MIIQTGGRTDTVQYFSEWLLNRFKAGTVLTRNPRFPQNITRYSLDPKTVDCVVFCSKNYAPILPRLNEITDRFNTYFFYTITAYGKDIEPGVPSIDQSIDTLIKLEKLVGKQRICWRYDPVLLTKHYTIQQHLITFEHMAARLQNHVSRCVFSFVELYQKLQHNMPELILLTEADMDTLAKGMGTIAAKYHIPLQICATETDYTRFGIQKAGCTTLDILGKANNIQFKKLKHTGMRPGCHCIPSHDIGAYDTCPNGCHYCYANSDPETARKNFSLHDPKSELLLGTIQKEDVITDALQKSFIEPTVLQLDLFHV